MKPGEKQYIATRDIYLESAPFSTLYHATMIIPEHYVADIYQQLALAHQEHTQSYGFANNRAPLVYVRQEYQVHLIEQVKEFLFKFFVINNLYKKIRSSKLLVAGDPRLTTMEVIEDGSMRVNFDLTILPTIAIQPWKYLPFKPPRRKRYKDLDRQVELFLQDETERLKDYTDSVVADDDWICVDIALADAQQNLLLDGHREQFWIKMGGEEADAPLHELFIGKKVGDTFFSNHEALQDYFNEQAFCNFTFNITIIDIVPNAYVCNEQLKKQFRIKTRKELHQKIIEIFSYRNDISLRRDMIEEAYQILLERNHFEIPHFLLLRQQEQLLEKMQKNPDYAVYKMQKDFKEYIEKLSEKQLKEALFMLQLAYDEDLDTSHEDIKQYLNLLKRQKTREFIYFQPPSSKSYGQECPLATEELKHTCLREKALNFILYHLTKK